LDPEAYPQHHRRPGLRFRRSISCNNIAALFQFATRGMESNVLPHAFFRHMIKDGKLTVIETGEALPTVKYFANFSMKIMSIYAIWSRKPRQARQPRRRCVRLAVRQAGVRGLFKRDGGAALEIEYGG
jgi:hypothetical protein